MKSVININEKQQALSKIQNNNIHLGFSAILTDDDDDDGSLSIGVVWSIGHCFLFSVGKIPAVQPSPVNVCFSRQID
ncbi:hypothetical protein DERP_012942 [Dermatophagoides pteronyssinus]|uniref:Uncharacterized protein n=1 Tax=Dermatophagoides pteronyssinus TaxID=6956 RepID=A0ABQ8J3S1_DERPT|nr:hypothetical protein DERP_012942 [Dermatophagoides pteronyssinus]